MLARQKLCRIATRCRGGGGGGGGGVVSLLVKAKNKAPVAGEGWTGKAACGKWL